MGSWADALVGRPAGRRDRRLEEAARQEESGRPPRWRLLSRTQISCADSSSQSQMHAKQTWRQALASSFSHRSRRREGGGPGGGQSRDTQQGRGRASSGCRHCTMIFQPIRVLLRSRGPTVPLRGSHSDDWSQPVSCYTERASPPLPGAWLSPSCCSGPSRSADGSPRLTQV